MLFVIELVFLGVGLWVSATGKVPLGGFRLLFGKGDYSMQPGAARLFGVLLASPLPVSALVSTVLITFAPRQSAYALVFEIVYTLAVIVAALVIARRARRPEIPGAEPGVAASTTSEPRSGTYGSRLLIVVGLAVLSCITAVSLGTLVLMAGSIAAYGATLTGNFMDDYFPWLMLVAVTGLGAYGIVDLVKRLRRRPGSEGRGV